MVILRVSESTLDDVFLRLQSHEGYFDGFEIEVETLKHPEREDWESISRRTQGFRILSLPRALMSEAEPVIDFYRTLLKRRLFDMVRIPYEEYKPRGVHETLEKVAHSYDVGVIRSISIRNFSAYPFPFAQDFVKERDVLHLTLNPSGWKELGPIVERVILDRTVETWGMRRSFAVEGPYGYPFQVLSSHLGSYFTFTSPQSKGPLVDPITLKTVYRYTSLTPHTALFGIIGNPVLHSRSPHLHNRGYDALGIDAVYVPFPVDDLEPFFSIAPKLPLRGLSVTIPHKESVLKYCDWCEDSVLAVGACNTLVFSEKSIKGYNTDVEGFLVPLNRVFPRVTGKKALVIGAGGAARSIVYGLAREGARVLILNRTVAKAESLAAEMGKTLSLSTGTITTGPLDREGASRVEQFQPDLVVQTTSCGMHPYEEEDPFPDLFFKGQEVVYDLVYAPRETRFLKRAKAAGCTVIYGDAMLIHQAFRQFLLFTGKEYPRQLIDGI
ncbi:MAG: shikimate dehydrogenase [Spirochaetes bacterium]|nr:shikimate dehydrogenase [Spirochaetota bacterium]